MNFGEALVELKNGQQVQRSGWNGKGMFIFLVPGREIPVQELREDSPMADAVMKARIIGTHKGETVKTSDHIDMLAADGSFTIGWNPSQIDMQAEDWQVVKLL